MPAAVLCSARRYGPGGHPGYSLLTDAAGIACIDMPGEGGMGVVFRAEDFSRLATAAYLLGRDDPELWARTFQACAEDGDGHRAARCGFLLAFGLFSRGEGASAVHRLARAGGQTFHQPEVIPLWVGEGDHVTHQRTTGLGGDDHVTRRQGRAHRVL